jgi:autotransporter-associated beta strand protein
MNLSVQSGFRLTLTDPNQSFTGTVTVTNGRLTSPTFETGKLGTGTISMGNSNLSPYLIFTGSTNSSASDRNIAIIGTLTGGGANLDASGTGTWTLGGVYISSTLQVAKTVILMGSNGGDNTVAGVLANTGSVSGVAGHAGNVLSISKSGSGKWVLAGSNTYGGTTTLAGGTLGLAHANALGNGGSIIFSGGTLQFGAANTSDYASRIVSSGSAIALDTNGQDVTFAGTLAASNTGGLIKMGAGSLILSSSQQFTGLLTLHAGAVVLSHSGALNLSNPVGIAFGSGVSDGTLLRLNGNSFAVPVLSTGAIPGGAVVENGSLSASTLTLNGSSDFTFAGTLRDGEGGGALSVVKSGLNRVTLGGSGSYTGLTTIESGTLELSSSTALAAGGSISTNATTNSSLELSGGITVTGATLMLAGNGRNSLGALLSKSGSNTWAGNLTLVNFSGQRRIGVLSGSTLTISGGISGAGILLSAPSLGGEVKYTGANTWQGAMYVAGAGTSTFSTINSVNTNTALGTVRSDASNMGAPANSTDGRILFFSSPTLRYIGLGETTDRQLNFLNGATMPTLEQAGSGLLKFVTAPVVDGTSHVDLNLSGSSVGSGEISGNLANGSGTLSVTKRGTGLWTISGSNSYTGATTIWGGTLALGGSNALAGGGSVRFSGGTLSFGTSGANYFNSITMSSGTAVVLDSGGNSGTWSGGIDATNSGGLTKRGAGLLMLSGNNAYTGTTTISSGTLGLGHTSALGGGGDIVFSGGVLQFGAANTSDYASRIVGSGSAIALDTNGRDVTFSGSLAASNTGGLTKLGAGILTLSGSNVYTGMTMIGAGTIGLGHADALAGGGGIVFSGGTLQFGTANTSDYASRIVGSGSAIAIDTNGQEVTFAGTLAASNTGGLAKLGAGVLTLGGSNQYTGQTSVMNGTLRATSGSAFGSNSAFVLADQSGVLLDLNGFHQSVGSLAGGGTAGGHVQLGSALLSIRSNAADTAYAGHFLGAGSIVKEGGGTLTLSGSGALVGGLSVGAGKLVLAGTSDWSQAIFSVSAGTLDLSAANVSVGSLVLTGGKLSLAIGKTIQVASALVLDGIIDVSGTLDSSTMGRVTLLAGGAAASGAFTTGSLALGSEYRLQFNGSNLEIQRSSTMAIEAGSSNYNTRVGQSVTIGARVANVAPVDSDSLTYNLAGALSESLLTRESGDANASAGTLRTGTYTPSTAGTSTLSITASGTGANGPTNGSQTTTFTVTSYNLASGSASSSVNLGAIREGGNFASKTLTVENIAPTGGFSDDLAAAISATGAVSVSGVISRLAAGSQSMALSVGYNSTSVSAGSVSGTATVSYISKGQTGTGLADAAPIKTSDTVAVSGKVYRLAAANISSGTITLEPVRFGGTFAAASVPVTNTAALVQIAGESYNELLKVLAASDGDLSVVSAPSQSIAAQESSEVRVGLAAGTVGLRIGTLTLNFTSDGTGISGLAEEALGQRQIMVQGQVYSGQGVWRETNLGVRAWDDSANWIADGGRPGVDGALSRGVDTALLRASSALEVRMNGRVAELKSLKVEGAGNILVSQGSIGGGGFQLSANSGHAALDADGAGQHRIEVQVELGSNAVATIGAGSKLTLASVLREVGGGGYGLTKEGGGTLALQAGYNYGGTTAVNAGRLELGLGAVLGGGAITLGSGAELAFNLSADLTIPNTITGPGTVVSLNPAYRVFWQGGSTVRSAGLFVVNPGEHVYADAIVSSGSVAVRMNSGTVTSSGVVQQVLAKPLELDATNWFNVPHGSSLEWNGAISGTGGIKKGEGGNFILSGSNSFTGGTEIYGGTVEVRSAGALGAGTVNLKPNTQLRVNAGTRVLFENKLVGEGDLVKVGTHTMELNEQSQLSGSAVILQGTLAFGPLNAVSKWRKIVVGDSSSNDAVMDLRGLPGQTLVVGSGQTVQGSGVVLGSLQAAGSTTLQFGNSPGVITVNGDVNLTGLDLVRADYTTDFLQTGSAVVGNFFGGGAKLVLTSWAGVSPNRTGTARIVDFEAHKFTVISATGTVDGLSPQVDSYVQVNGSTYKSAVVSARVSKVGADRYEATVQRLRYADIGGDGNYRSLGSLLDEGVGNLGFGLVDLLDSQATSEGVRNLMAQINPAGYVELANVGLRRVAAVQGALANRLASSAVELMYTPAVDGEYTAWTTVYGGNETRDGDASRGLPGFDGSSAGNLTGVERQIGRIRLGMMGAAGVSHGDFTIASGRVSADSWHGGVYFQVPAARAVFDAGISYGRAETTVRRDFRGLGVTSARIENPECVLHFGMAIPIVGGSGKYTFVPSAHLIHSSYYGRAFSESQVAGGAEASVGRMTEHAYVGRLGLEASRWMELFGRLGRFGVRLDWLHHFDVGGRDADIAIGASEARSRFSAARGAADAVQVGLVGKLALTDRTQLRLNFDQQTDSRRRSFGGGVSLELKF